MSHYVYSYRLTCYNGAAPCDSEAFLSLAICKRDMRRVIGRRFVDDIQNGKKNTYWFIGIVGSSLSQQEEFKDHYERGDLFYVAKLKEVIPYEEYFSNSKYKKRKDCIYKEVSEDGKGKYPVSSPHFIHCETTDIHKSPFLQGRDWDIDHPKASHYVLIADEYAFLKNVKELQLGINQELAKGVGHKWFAVEDQNDQPIKALQKLIDDNKCVVLPASIKNCSRTCGKDKG